MGPAQAIRTGFAKSFQFSGRASRSEFWWFASPVFLALCPTWGWSLSTENYVTGTKMVALDSVFFLFTLLIYAVGSRRLTDAGRSRALLLCCAAIQGAIEVLILVALLGGGIKVEALEGIVLITILFMPFPIFTTLVI